MHPPAPRPAPLAPRPTGGQAVAPRAEVASVPPLEPEVIARRLRPDASAAPVRPRIVSAEEEG